MTRSFGPDSSWLAIRVTDHEVLRSALGLETLEETSHRRGLSRARSRKLSRVFITPPAGPWTLIVAGGSTAELLALAERAACGTHEVQLFVCRTRSQHFAWFRWRGGELERAFEQRAQRLLRDEGEPQRGEPAELGRVEEHQVLELADVWSVDPSTLGRKQELGETGWLGSFPGEARAGPSARDVLAGVLGTLGLVAIELVATLLLGRVFARSSHWLFGVAAGVVLIAIAAFARDGWKPKKLLLLAGAALALGAALGGAFPHRVD